MRQLLNVLIGSPACGNARQSAGMAEMPAPAPLPSVTTLRGPVMNRCHGGLGMVVTTHHPCLGLSSQNAFNSFRSVSPVGTLPLSVTFSRHQDCGGSLNSGLYFGDFPPQLWLSVQTFVR